MNPFIASTSPEDLFETGPIEVFGSGFLSSETLLLINGISAPIKIMTDTSIRAEIPLLGISRVYDVRVRTRILRRYPQNSFSNPEFVFIKSVSQLDSNLRVPPEVIIGSAVSN